MLRRWDESSQITRFSGPSDAFLMHRTRSAASLFRKIFDVYFHL
jgi:hypothetical protein